MKLYVITTEPAQQIAAEPATLERLTARLRTQMQERHLDGAGGDISGLPLVADPSIAPGFIHLRPTPKKDGTE
ncbi:hypothetical protein ACIOWI_29595 [Streptomyces sp. NPDC087659]|uniref:hypothetical protein n=1 Tax=Streptomyces sp. NPDC087659 TaxID=3365801 RepID=UPI0037F66934